MIDWSKCPDVESVPGKVSGAWVIRGTRIPAQAVVDNANDGNTVGPSEINGEAVNPLIGWCLTYLTNFTGNPAASVPAGLSPDSLPIGLQIIGRRHSDVDVLAASAEFERRRPWFGDFSKCWG